MAYKRSNPAMVGRQQRKTNPKTKAKQTPTIMLRALGSYKIAGFHPERAPQKSVVAFCLLSCAREKDVFMAVFGSGAPQLRLHTHTRARYFSQPCHRTRHGKAFLLHLSPLARRFLWRARARAVCTDLCSGCTHMLRT